MAEQAARQSAVIFNPVKVADDFRDTVSRRLSEAGWSEPLWLETAEDDPGRSMAATAREAEVDLVLAAGGDGTVRVVADGLAGSKITMAILPSGTANLLALNLGIPNPLDQALDIALAGHTKTIDLIKITVDGEAGEHYAVMAGVGVDAMIMDETRPELKDKIGSAAYFVAAAKALGRLPIPMQIKVDDHHARRRRAMICLIGNVSQLPGNISVIPDAAPDDGLLDVYVASPHRITHWVRVFLRLITRRSHGDDKVDQWRGRRVELRLRTPDNYQLDGDVVGEMRTLVAEVQPGALTICVPSEQ